jgi:hypothetical protein
VLRQLLGERGRVKAAAKSMSKELSCKSGYLLGKVIFVVRNLTSSSWALHSRVNINHWRRGHAQLCGCQRNHSHYGRRYADLLKDRGTVVKIESSKEMVVPFGAWDLRPRFRNLVP